MLLLNLKNFISCMISNHSPQVILPLLRNITGINPILWALLFHLSIYRCVTEAMQTLTERTGKKMLGVKENSALSIFELAKAMKKILTQLIKSRENRQGIQQYVALSRYHQYQDYLISFQSVSQFFWRIPSWEIAAILALQLWGAHTVFTL